MLVHLLLATVPSRRVSVENLLSALSTQTFVPAVLHLCLEGYGDLPSPRYPDTLTVVEHRSEKASGPGARWRVLSQIPAEAVLVVLDDDRKLLGQDVIEGLVKAVEGGGAASLMGTEPTGWGLMFTKGKHLIAMGAAVMVLHMSDLVGLDETLSEIRSKCGFDPFADAGDDEAVIAAHLWRKGVIMRATGPLAIVETPGTQVGSQFEKRRATKGTRSLFWQRQEIRRVTGWPWVSLTS